MLKILNDIVTGGPMIRFLMLIYLCFSIPSFSNDSFKQEILDSINSNLKFYTKIEPGMGFTGELLSDLVDENGSYLNCTIAFRGKNIIINTNIDKDYIYSYQEHWIEINIKDGNNCNPELYPKEHNKFVTMDKRRNPLEIIDILKGEDVFVEKIDKKIYLLKYTIFDDQTNKEINVTEKYNLNFPLFLNPDSDGFKHQYLDYSTISLNSIGSVYF
jgi:hypothetical protein